MHSTQSRNSSAQLPQEEKLQQGESMVGVLNKHPAYGGLNKVIEGSDPSGTRAKRVKGREQEGGCTSQS